MAVNGRNESSCEETVKEIAHGSFAVPGDVGAKGVAHDLVDAVLERTGRIDVLINNSGIALDNFATGDN